MMKKLKTVVVLLICTNICFSTGEDSIFNDEPEFTFTDLQTLKELLSVSNLLNPELGERSQTCNLHLEEYLSDLLKLKLWALQMFDSTAKIPEGILYANHEYLGQYDECLTVIHPNRTFRGQHCVLEGELNFHFPGVPADQKSVFWYGLCLPSTCSPRDINNGVAIISNVTKNLITVKADENFCHTADEGLKATSGDWVVVGFLSLLGVFMLISTFYDLQKQGKSHPVLSSFSICKNLKSLFATNNGADQMMCLNGVRVMSMVWIVFFHVFTSVVAAPVINITEAFKARTDPLYAVLASAYLAVDSFLLMSGLLLALSFFRAVTKTGTYDVPLGYIHRYFRLTPSYAMVLLFQVTVFHLIGDGPMWYFIQNSQTSVCKKYWWSGLLYIQNYVNPDDLCLTQTWYLSADMQLYWLSPLVLYPMWKWRKFAPAYISILTLIFTFLPFALAYTYGFAPLPMMDNTGDQNRLDNYPTYSRATPWLVGVALGYLIFDLKDKNTKINFSKIVTMTGWIIAGVVGGLSLFGILSFEYDETYTPSVASFNGPFYLAFHRLGWALALAWLIFACINGKGGIINTFLSWGFFGPMGKLSYGVYLSHITVLFYKLGIARTNMYFNLAEMFFLFLGVYAVSHFVSILLYLFIEAPFFTIDRHLLRNAKILPLPRPKTKDKKVES